MDRRACVSVPELALQLLAAAHPGWRSLPAAVVDVDEPNGILLAVNAPAWRARLRPGMRYASALALERRLRAGTVAASAVETAVGDLVGTLRGLTPRVEPSTQEPGVFWLDANGLESLYTSVTAWSHAVQRAVRGKAFHVNVACGFTRFGTYALARSLAAAAAARRSARRVLVCESPDEERRLVRDVRLEHLGIDPKVRDALARLAVHTVGDFVRLPPDGIRRRFGEDASLLHRRARGETWDPLVPLAPEEPLVRSVLLEDPVSDSGIVLLIVRRLLATLLVPLAARERAVRSVTVTLRPSLRRDAEAVTLTVATAAPTLEEGVLADLVRLRLQSVLAGARKGSFLEIEVEVEAAPAGADQLRLFHERTRRDLDAGARALARLRAELGEDAVVRAVLREGHLPEATYTWENASEVREPSPRLVLQKPLVRRVYERAIPLPPRPFRERDDCWIAPALEGRGGGNAHGRVDHMTGPYIVSGGWWNREVHREYHYARTEDGEILWVYYDRPRRRWFLAGRLE